MEEHDRIAFGDLLGRQKTIYIMMRDILNKQAQALEKGETEKLIALMGEVNDFKVEAATLQKTIEPLKQQWEMHKDNIPDAERQSLMLKVEEIKNVLSAVLEAMNNLHSNVHDKKDDTKQRLIDIQRSQAARQGYGSLGKMPTPSRYMDRKE